MGGIFSKPKVPDPLEVARANEQARKEAQDRADAEAREAEGRFAASEERGRQRQRRGRSQLIANPSGYLGVTDEFYNPTNLLY